MDQFTWCKKKEQWVASSLCKFCTIRGCTENKLKITKIHLSKQEFLGNMYIGKKSTGQLVVIEIQDFKNPTSGELDGIDLVYVVKDIYKPETKITLTNVKEVQNNEGETTPKRRGKRKSQGEV